MPTLNYTTRISAAKSIAEVTSMLVKAGVSTVATRYSDGRAVGLAFTMPTPHGPRDFELPVNVEGVAALLAKQEKRGDFRSTRKAKGYFSTPEHAEKVAWRVMKDWMEAQLAMIEAEMADIIQVMLPYVIVGIEGKTLHEVYREREQAAIEG